MEKILNWLNQNGGFITVLSTLATCFISIIAIYIPKQMSKIEHNREVFRIKLDLYDKLVFLFSSIKNFEEYDKKIMELLEDSSDTGTTLENIIYYYGKHMDGIDEEYYLAMNRFDFLVLGKEIDNIINNFKNTYESFKEGLIKIEDISDYEDTDNISLLEEFINDSAELISINKKLIEEIKNDIKKNINKAKF